MMSLNDVITLVNNEVGINKRIQVNQNVELFPLSILETTKYFTVYFQSKEQFNTNNVWFTSLAINKKTGEHEIVDTSTVFIDDDYAGKEVYKFNK